MDEATTLGGGMGTGAGLSLVWHDLCFAAGHGGQRARDEHITLAPHALGCGIVVQEIAYA